MFCEDGKYTYRFTGKTPLEAASKAYTYMLQLDTSIDTNAETIVSILESTRGCDKQIYKFRAKRICNPSLDNTLINKLIYIES